MNGLQQGIKWFAIALATVIICTMVAVMAGGFWLLSCVFDEVSSGEVVKMEEVKDWMAKTEITDLDIELKVANLEIKTSSELKVETNSEKIQSLWDGNKLKVCDEESHWFFDWADVYVVVYVPKDIEFETVKVETGAGQVVIERLAAKRADLDLGAERTEIGELVVGESAEVDGGAGALEIRDGYLKNLDFDMGVGRASIRARLVGSSKIDAGVGKLELILLGEGDDYYVDVNQGIGGLSQRGISLRNPNGKNVVKIDGGVGALELQLEEKSDKSCEN